MDFTCFLLKKYVYDDINDYLLLLMFILPLIFTFTIILFNSFFKKDWKHFSVYFSFIIYLITLFFISFLDELNLNHFLFYIHLAPVWEISFFFGLDNLNFFFILLTNLFIFLSCLFCIQSNFKDFQIFIYLFSLQWAINGAFLSYDLLSFFIFFEATIFPIFFLILIYGSRERRIYASFLILLYTIFGSIFLFFVILYFYSKFGTTNFFFLQNFAFLDFEKKFLWLFLFLGFSTKIPMFPVHIWLPEAHVEAPTLGSVFLAVILLKLGSYGMVRFILELFNDQTVYFYPFFCILAILSIIYTSLIALRQIDLKKIIAYSSVGHMNVIVLALLLNTAESIEGALFQMLSHGLVSGALFFCIGSFYLRFKVRSLEYFGGFMNIFPILSIFFLIFGLANISFPGTSSFVGEFMIFFGILKKSFIFTIFGALSMILGAAFMLWALNRALFGNLRSEFIIYYKDSFRIEAYIYFFLVFLVIVLGLYPSYILMIFQNCTFMF